MGTNKREKLTRIETKPFGYRGHREKKRVSRRRAISESKDFITNEHQ